MTTALLKLKPYSSTTFLHYSHTFMMTAMYHTEMIQEKGQRENFRHSLSTSLIPGIHLSYLITGDSLKYPSVVQRFPSEVSDL